MSNFEFSLLFINIEKIRFGSGLIWIDLEHLLIAACALFEIPERPCTSPNPSQLWIRLGSAWIIDS